MPLESAHMKSLATLFATFAFAASTFAATIVPASLKCEYGSAPLGVDVAAPRLYWTLAGAVRGARQTAYQLQVASSVKSLTAGHADLWDSGKEDSDETAHVRYAGKELKSSQQVFWKVRVWGEAGKPSAWSAPATWTMGVLRAEDWAGARWLGTTDTNVQNVLLRREFTVKPGLQRALVHVCGLGQYELFLNGKKSGDALLAPGWTKYDQTVLYETHDVTAALRRGDNALGLTLGNGMFNVVSGGRFAKFKKSFGGQRAIAQLRLEYADGLIETIVTDDQWKQGGGPITFNSIYGGEDYDARLEQRGWNAPGFNAASWPQAQIVAAPGGQLSGWSCSAPPLKAIETHRTVAMHTLTNGEVVYDLGQNTSHLPRVHVTGPRGSKVRLTPSELLGADGAVDQVSMGAGRRGSSWWEFTKATDGLEEWTPQFCYIGCRYLQVRLTAADGGKKLPRVQSVEGVVVHSSAESTGEFSCSNELFNRTRLLVRWAQRANMVSVLTDCPHREKLGWLEQYHLNGPAIRYEFDLDALYTKGMNDMADSQLASGLVPTTAPEYTIFRDKDDLLHERNRFGDSPEWGSAYLIVPWQQYEFAGDLDLVRAHYESMTHSVAFLSTRATNNILSHGLGDWYDLGPKPPGVSQLTPIPLPATAVFFYDHWLLAQMAKLLGKTDEAWQFNAKAEEIRTAFNARFFNATNGSYATGSQAANAIPLVMGLVEPADRTAVLDALVRDVRARTNALTAGDVGYRYLLRALADGGRSDVIFDINNQSDKPGYGYQLKMGATSLTEAWDARRNSSHNHFMLGQITEWFYHDLAGIGCDAARGAGFKHIIIAPQPVGDVTWVNAEYKSLRGEIKVAWRRTGARFTLDFTIPANTTATVCVPTKSLATVTEGGRLAASSTGVKFIREENGRAVFEVVSGRYVFKSAL